MNYGSELLEGYDYNKPLVHRWEGYGQNALQTPVWYSDEKTYTVQIPENFSGLTEITYKVRTGFLILYRYLDNNTTVLKPIFEVALLNNAYTLNDSQYKLGLDGYSSDVEVTFNYNTETDDIRTTMFKTDYNLSPSRDNFWKMFSQVYGNLDYTVQHTSSGKLGGLKFILKFLDTSYFHLYGWDGSSNNKIKNAISIPPIEFSHVFNDTDFVPYIPKAAYLPEGEKNNIIDMKWGVKFPKAENPDKDVHYYSYYIDVEVANHYPSIIAEAEKNGDTINQTYTKVLDNIKIKDNFTLDLVTLLLERGKLKAAHERALGNASRYFWDKKQYFTAIFRLFGKILTDTYLPCKITLRTRVNTHDYTYHVYDDSGVNEVNELRPSEYSSVYTFPASKQDGRLYTVKRPDVDVELKYNIPKYIDGVKVSDDSFVDVTLNTEEFDKLYEDYDFKLDLIDSEDGKNKGSLEIDENGKAILTDLQAEKLQNGEWLLNPTFKTETGTMYPNFNYFEDSNLNNNQNNNTNTYFKAVGINNNVKLSLEDYDVLSTSVTQDSSVFIQNRSRIKVTIPSNFFIFQDENNILKLIVTINDEERSINFTKNTAHSVQFYNNLNIFGTNTVKLTFQDREDVISTYSQDFQVLRYSEPSSNLNVEYIDVQNNTMSVQLNAVISQILNKNKLNILKFRYKPSLKNNWSEYYIDSLSNDYQNVDLKRVYLSTKVLINDSLSFTDNTFDFEIVISDIFKQEKVYRFNKIGLGVPFLFFDERLNSTGFNCFPAERNTATFKHITFDNQETTIISENNVLKLNRQLEVENINILDKIAELEQKITELLN